MALTDIIDRVHNAEKAAGRRQGDVTLIAVSKVQPNARVEAHIHIVGLMMLLGLMLYVTIFNDFKLGK